MDANSPGSEAADLPDDELIRHLDAIFDERFARIYDLPPKERVRFVQAQLRSAEAHVAQLLEVRWQSIKELRERGASYEEIAALLGVSKSRAQQLARAASKLP